MEEVVKDEIVKQEEDVDDEKNVNVNEIEENEDLICDWLEESV